MFYVRVLHVMEAAFIIVGTLLGSFIMITDSRAAPGITLYAFLAGIYVFVGAIVGAVIFGSLAELVRSVLAIERSLSGQSKL